MKKLFLFAAALLFLFLCAGCDTIVQKGQGVTPPDMSIEEGPISYGEDTLLKNAIPVEVDSDMLQACYDYIGDWGYEIADKSKYNSILLGKSLVSDVYLDDDGRIDMLGEDDYLIVFESMRVVVDADTGIVLGHIPYV